MRQITRALMSGLLAGVISAVSFSAYSQTEVSKEYQLKAVFLFNFIQFVQWPETSFEEESSPFIIGILGNDPFGFFLDKTVEGEAVNGHPLVVQRYRSVEEIGKCHILFVGISDRKVINQALDSLSDKNILTVSDLQNFGAHGGMIGFVTREGKVRFQINHKAAEEANLIISTKLLRLAEIVE